MGFILRDLWLIFIHNYYFCSMAGIARRCKEKNSDVKWKKLLIYEFFVLCKFYILWSNSVWWIALEKNLNLWYFLLILRTPILCLLVAASSPSQSRVYLPYSFILLVVILKAFNHRAIKDKIVSRKSYFCYSEKHLWHCFHSTLFSLVSIWVTKTISIFSTCNL